MAFAAASSASTIAWISSGVAARPRRRRRVAARRFIMARTTEPMPRAPSASSRSPKRSKIASTCGLFSASVFSPSAVAYKACAPPGPGRRWRSPFLEHGQCRIDDAGARQIFAPDPLAELLDDLVAVAGLLGDQRKSLSLLTSAPLIPAPVAELQLISEALHPVKSKVPALGRIVLPCSVCYGLSESRVR